MVIKVCAHQWLTFTSMDKYNAYFDNMVKDASKFEQFSQIKYIVHVQKSKQKKNNLIQFLFLKNNFKKIT